MQYFRLTSNMETLPYDDKSLKNQITFHNNFTHAYKYITDFTNIHTFKPLY